MALSEKELEYFTNIKDEFEADAKPCNDWERGFFGDQLERFDEYGNDTRFSPKQWNIIYKIGDLYDIERPV